MPRFVENFVNSLKKSIGSNEGTGQNTVWGLRGIDKQRHMINKQICLHLSITMLNRPFTLRTVCTVVLAVCTCINCFYFLLSTMNLSLISGIVLISNPTQWYHEYLRCLTAQPWWVSMLYFFHNFFPSWSGHSLFQLRVLDTTCKFHEGWLSVIGIMVCASYSFKEHALMLL